ncbi:hypothetical protein Kpol_348p14 [Vanderwaltozyma polyspora DSM 70294]|uniref:TEL2-interacting protein 1 n=1 Tax=Vanderwaltozyma polyspora (strain ATCC 22028 / DSM 70294 / BCRC 21397 / CBS 2163 / NBRC 10782 / NRRL Y-8283 / UCD 57-17) TaxID=436907 RepID=A7TS60_VANPO|nr:uncharacterized protein Kpol_348p14 [Vanderwaltozyma polyspora DSM 70294]EDO14910.1 hypothetical protein Kpol_348p14 [Vanderwaltozyma polyspora DSM 70294]
MVADSEAFQEIRPLCVELSKLAFQERNIFDSESSQLKDALKSIEQKLSGFQTDSLSLNFADYVFVPIGSLLKQERLGTPQTELVLQIIGHLLRLCWHHSGTLNQELATQLFPLLTYLISPDKDNEKLKGMSVYYKLVSAQLLKQFFTSVSQQSYKQEFFTSGGAKLLPSLGHCITILLDLLGSVPYDIKLQLCTLEGLEILYKKLASNGELLSFVLPGNISAFAKILSLPGLNIQYKVVSSTLHIFTLLLRTVYDDVDLNVSESNKNVLQLLPETLDDDLKLSNDLRLIKMDGYLSESSKKHRDIAWLKATSAQIKRALNSFTEKNIKRQNASINMELEKMAYIALSNCSISLSNCSDDFLNILVSLKSSYLLQLPNICGSLREIIESKFVKIGNALHFDDTIDLDSLSFAFKILWQMEPDKSMLSLATTSILDSLSTFSEQSIQKYEKSKVIEQTSNVIIKTVLQESDANQEFLLPYLPNDTESSLSQLIKSIGSTIDNNEILDETINSLLTGDLKSNIQQKLLSLWVSTRILVGSKLLTVTSTDDELLDFGNCESEVVPDSCYSILEYGNELYQEIVFLTEGSQMSKNSEQAYAIVLDSIMQVSEVMNKEFESELIDYIYIIVDSLASSSPIIRNRAQVCAMSIAKNLYSGSIQNLLMNNVDYLVESISNRLNSGMTERASKVLMVICKLSGYEVIDKFKDVIETVFRLLDYYHGYSELCLQFFQFFEIIIIEMKKTFLNESDNSKIHEDVSINTCGFAPWGIQNWTQLVSLLDSHTMKDAKLAETIEVEIGEPNNFQDYFDQKLKEIDSDDEEEIEEDSDFDMESQFGGKEQMENKWESPIPKESYRILLKIINYSDRLLMHPSKPLKVQILKVVKMMLPLLATQKDSLLPPIAQIWGSIAECIMDSDFSIVKPACECVQMIIKHSKDFVTKRFVDMWQELQKRSHILKEVHLNNTNTSQTSVDLIFHQKFAPITKDALISLSSMLLEGIAVSELLLSETVVKEMMYCCIQVLPTDTIASKSIYLGDVIWDIMH